MGRRLLVNVLNPGDKVLLYETGQFANLWRALAKRLGLDVEVVGKAGQDTWRWGVDAAVIEERLRQDTSHEIKAVCVVHNETSTGVTSNIAAVRKAIDSLKHPALLLVDSDLAWVQQIMSMINGVRMSPFLGHKKG